MDQPQLNTTQKIFLIWFVILSFMASYNFYTNVTDDRRQSILEKDYLQNKEAYVDSMKEHEEFKQKHAFLEGAVLGRCSNQR